MTKFDRFQILISLINQLEVVESDIAHNTTYTEEHKDGLIQRNAKIVQGIVDRLVDGDGGVSGV